MNDSASDGIDILIIGGGPVGLYAAYYAGFRGLRAMIADSLPVLGGQIATLYPEKLIRDVAGFPGIKGQDLVGSLVDQATQFDPLTRLGDPIERLESTHDRVGVVTASGSRLTARTALIAGGAGTFSPRTHPVIEPWVGRGARYFVPRLRDLVDQDVLVVGGGDSAFDWAFSLEGIAASVSLVHRRRRFRAHEALVDEVRDLDIPLFIPYEVDEVTGNESVEAVTVRNTETGEQTSLPIQSIVAAMGFLADFGPIRSWGLELLDRGIAVDSRMRTSAPRVFAAGDIAEYDGKVKLISVGFGEAATAVNHAATIVDSTLELFPGHSTDEAVPA